MLNVGFFKAPERIMEQTKSWNFILFFNYKDAEGKIRAEEWRNDSSVYLREVFERVARFSAFAKEESGTSLRLRGFVSMKNGCTQSHVKRILGKYSHCKLAAFEDVINMIQCFNIDRETTLTGKLAVDVDVKFGMRVIQGCGKRKRGDEVVNQNKEHGESDDKSVIACQVEDGKDPRMALNRLC